jgi:hypothetical protein
MVSFVDGDRTFVVAFPGIVHRVMSTALRFMEADLALLGGMKELSKKQDRPHLVYGVRQRPKLKADR